MRWRNRLGLALCIGLCTAPAAAQLVDRETIFAQARAIAACALAGVETADLALFRIAYSLTLLETGNPHGGFEVDMLLRSSRSVVPAQEVVAAAPDAELRSGLEALLAGVEFAYHYRTVRVRFAELGDEPSSAAFSTLLLNRDPGPAVEELSSEAAPDAAREAR